MRRDGITDKEYKMHIYKKRKGVYCMYRQTEVSPEVIKTLTFLISLSSNVNKILTI